MSSGPRFDVTSIGEAMLRLCAPTHERLVNASHVAVRVGGVESNVLATLSQLGRACGWVSQLPDHALGHCVTQRLDAVKVDTSAVRMIPNSRVGLNFFEGGNPPFPANVIYDRANSAFATISPEDVDWTYLLDTRVVHLTGVTPALSPSCLDVTRRAVDEASSRGVRISFDVNYRSKLWSPLEALEVLRQLVRNVSILFCSRRDAELVFGCSGGNEQVVDQLRAFTSAEVIVLTLGAEGAILARHDETVTAPAVPVQIVDRPGAGDALAAGVLDGVLDGAPDVGLERGLVLAALALAQNNDFVFIRRQELEDFRRRKNLIIDR